MRRGSLAALFSIHTQGPYCVISSDEPARMCYSAMFELWQRVRAFLSYRLYRAHVTFSIPKNRLNCSGCLDDLSDYVQPLYKLFFGLIDEDGTELLVSVASGAVRSVNFPNVFFVFHNHMLHRSGFSAFGLPTSVTMTKPSLHLKPELLLSSAIFPRSTLHWQKARNPHRWKHRGFALTFMPGTLQLRKRPMNTPSCTV